MKTSRFLIYTLLAAQSIILSGCDKELSEPPANARVEGNTITDQKTAQTVLNGAYYQFAQVSSDNVTNWKGHQVSGGLLAGTIAYGYGELPDERNENVSSFAVPQFWNETYMLINAANGVIDGIAPVSSGSFTGNRKNEIIAESRFLRAYGHFRLLTFFAEWFNQNSPNGVLIRDKFTLLSQAHKARSSVSESYTHILQDLDFAIANAPATNPNYYATKWTAMALKMRVLLCRGQQADYISAAEIGNTLITTGPFSLENNLKDLFRSKGLASTEVILGIKAQPAQELFYYNVSGSYYPGLSDLFVATSAYKDFFDDSDPRKTWIIGPENPNAFIPLTQFYFTKYIDFGGSPSQITETSYAFRLSEVYLMRAEAIIRSNGSLATAKMLIKTVMGKAGATNFTAVDNATTTDQLLLQNYYEVSRNLCGEDSIEWLALMRLPFDRVKQLRPTITNTAQFYFPVPIAEFASNPLFGAQNTGYSK